jgi:hypothetical protein
MHDLETVFREISRKSHKGFVRFHSDKIRKTPVIAKILQRFGLLQECENFLAPSGEVFAYASPETFSCQVPFYKFLALSRSRFAKFLHVTVFQPDSVTRHDKWQVSFNPDCKILASYKLSELVWSEPDNE